MKPASIKTFDLLWFAMIALGLVGLALSWGTLMEGTDAALAESGLGEDAGLFASIAVVGGALLGTGINVALWFLVSVLRIEIVKWVLVALALWAVISIPAGLEAAGGFTMVFLPGLLSTTLMVGAIVFLFRPDAKAWFAEKRGGSE